MVKLDKIYTRGGDAGATSLAFGGRMAKHASRVQAMGAVDEANAMLGVCRAELARAGLGDYDPMLGRIQNDLFDLGADLATPHAAVAGTAKATKVKSLRVSPAQVARLERELDSMNAQLPPLRSFVLPGGNAAAAYLHLARTVVRRAERAITKLASEARVDAPVLAYINRLSDHIFVMARGAAAVNGADAVLWQPARYGAHEGEGLQ